ncbi:Taste receptor type 2 member 41 [Heterocephalus glaber]|uniref:Taste receptor type 2 n=1 Tax=Heterocephalus glaber TaxID=10181 RepID=G5C2M6_HETGA|nr:taste receptor type 2 member 41 [Heterocephalus glaber]EHB15787.1 Taste receptor type 2 member 41 [Heterocephalus glaber]
MEPALTIFFALLFVLVCVLGILANGFIVLMLSRERLRRGRLLPSDMILFGLGASRCGHQCLGLVYNFYYSFHLVDFSKSLARQFISLQMEFLNSSTFWFAAWLSVLFCVKIANFSHPAFFWLKWRLPALVPWLLLGSVLISLLVTLLFLWGNFSVYQSFLMSKLSGNLTEKEWNRNLEIRYYMPLKLVVLSIPCSLFLVSILLLIGSLRKHSLRMQNNAHDPQGHSNQVHTRALKSLISFLVLYALSFVFLVIDATVIITSDSRWYWPWQILVYLSLSIHPFILIRSNLKLRGMVRQLLVLFRAFWVP